MWVDGVVPVAVPVVAGEVDGAHLLVGDFDAFGVGGVVELGLDGEAGGGGCGADQVDDRLDRLEWSAAPVDRDVAEESVFDLVGMRAE